MKDGRPCCGSEVAIQATVQASPCSFEQADRKNSSTSSSTWPITTLVSATSVTRSRPAIGFAVATPLTVTTAAPGTSDAARHVVCVMLVFTAT